MGKGLFKKKSSRSIQDKINALKNEKKHAAEEPQNGPPPGPPITPEEWEYLAQLEEGLRGKGWRAPKPEPRAAPAPAPDLAPPVARRSKPPENGESTLDPFSQAEHEVEKLVREAQRKRRGGYKRVSRPPEPEPEPEIEPEPEVEPELEAEIEPEAEPEIEIEPEPEPPPPPRISPKPPRRAAAPRIQPPRSAAQPPVFAPPPPAPAPPLPRRGVEESDYDRQGKLPFPPGTIVRLDDDSLAIIKEEIHNREYDLVYCLCANGRIDPRGLALYGRKLERLGRLPKEELDKIEKRQAWDRDRVIYYLDDIAYAAGIPPINDHAPAESASQSLVNPQPYDDGHSLQRGRRLSIASGGKSWEAVYWGPDNHGAIVAHSLNGHWELIHLDLDHFGEAVQPGPLLPPREIRAIEQEIIEKLKSQMANF